MSYLVTYLNIDVEINIFSLVRVGFLPPKILDLVPMLINFFHAQLS